MSTEMGGGGRPSGTCDIATIFSLESYTSTSIGVPEETDLLVQSITMGSMDTVIQLPVSPSPVSGRGFTAFVLAASFVVVLAAFLALWSSCLLCWVDSTEVIGHCVAMNGETRLSIATRIASLEAGLFEAIELSLEVINLVVLFMINYL